MSDIYDDVGPGKPPKKHQWPKGKSGNPKGRPKGAKSFRTVVQDVGRAKVKVMVDGEPKKLTGVEAQVRATQIRALKGAPASEARMLSLFEQYLPDEQTGAEGLTADEAKLLRSHEYFVGLLDSSSREKDSQTPPAPKPTAPAAPAAPAKEVKK